MTRLLKAGCLFISLSLAGSHVEIAQANSTHRTRHASARRKAAGTAAHTNPAAASGNPQAIIDTTMGKLTCILYPQQASKTVANFIGLSDGTKEWTNAATHFKNKGTPLYSGTIFHRVIPNFMIQGGDPQGTGEGDPGYSFEDEFSASLKFDQPGRLAMANSGPATNGSQFFITEVPVPHLNGKHTIFGQCDAASVALVKKIARVPRDESNDRPLKAVVINKITVVQHAASPSGVRKPATRRKTHPSL